MTNLVTIKISHNGFIIIHEGGSTGTIKACSGSIHIIVIATSARTCHSGHNSIRHHDLTKLVAIVIRHQKVTATGMKRNLTKTIELSRSASAIISTKSTCTPSPSDGSARRNGNSTNHIVLILSGVQVLFIRRQSNRFQTIELDIRANTIAIASVSVSHQSRDSWRIHRHVDDLDSIQTRVGHVCHLRIRSDSNANGVNNIRMSRKSGDIPRRHRTLLHFATPFVRK